MLKLIFHRFWRNELKYHLIEHVGYGLALKKEGLGMINLLAERVQEKAIPNMDEIKKLFVVTERDRIAELAETDEIKKLRKEYQHENEMIYEADRNMGRDILSFAFTLSGTCGKNVYVGQDAAVYFEILDMRDFLLKKYAELPVSEAAKYEDEVKSYIDEANEELAFLKSQILKK